MPTCIKVKDGGSFYSNEEPEVLQGQINRGELITVWWFAAWGQRFQERLLIPEDNVAYLLTESDDG